MRYLGSLDFHDIKKGYCHKRCEIHFQNDLMQSDLNIFSMYQRAPKSLYTIANDFNKESFGIY